MTDEGEFTQAKDEARTMRRILVVEDEEAIRIGLSDHLEDEGFTVLLASDGTTALRHARESEPDLILLDLLLPDVGGLEICSRLRETGYRKPILILTAKDLEEDKVRGLDLGADDYITKPFGIQELLARIRAHLRRTGPALEPPLLSTTRVGPTEIDLKGCRIRRGKKEYSLSPMEIKMLEILIENRGNAVSRDDFLSRIWGFQAANTRTVDFHIFRLRRKIEKDSNAPRYLRTIHGIGYKLEAES